jgi:drug/metabolite transporter (DMT)-like permease
MLFGSIPLVVVAFLTADSGPEWTAPFVAALLYNVVLVCAVALLLWFYTLRHLPAGTAGLGRLLAPVVGVVAAWIQLGERPDRYELIGMVLILIGLASLAAWQIARDRSGSRAEAPLPIVLAEEPPGD